MSLLFMDSFDHYATADMGDKWNTAPGGNHSISAGNGRRGTGCFRASLGSSITTIKGVIASGSTAIVGTAVKSSTFSNTARVFGIADSVNGKDHIYVQINSDGSLSVLRAAGISVGAATAGVILGTSVPILTTNNYAYIELKIVLSATVGSVVLKVNSVVMLNLINQNTIQNTTVWNTVWLSNFSTGGSPITDYDDLYICDGAGAAPWNDFLGDVRVDPRVPTAPGATTGWTPSTGANWQNVDDALVNDDTDFNSAAGVLTDTFVVQDAPVVGATILGVQHCISAKKTDVGIGTIAPVIRHSGTDNVGASQGFGTTYSYVVQMNQTNPGTGLAWTEADFNAAEFGYKRLT